MEGVAEPEERAARPVVRGRLRPEAVAGPEVLEVLALQVAPGRQGSRVLGARDLRGAAGPERGAAGPERGVAGLERAVARAPQGSL